MTAADRATSAASPSVSSNGATASVPPDISSGTRCATSQSWSAARTADPAPELARESVAQASRTTTSNDATPSDTDHSAASTPRIQTERGVSSSYAADLAGRVSSSVTVLTVSKQDAESEP